MWEKFNKVIIQNAIAFMVIACCIVVVIVSMFHPIPAESAKYVDKFYDMCLVGVLGWLYTMNKNKQQ